MRRGFTLIELMVVLVIIAVMVSIAVVSVTGNREAAHVRDASRAVLQMSRYASSLALLRQRPVVVTYRKHRIDVQLSGDTVTEEDVGSPAAPIYMEVDGEEISQNPFLDEEGRLEAEGDADSAQRHGAGRSAADEKASIVFTQDFLDPEELAKEDASREFEDVWFTIEVLGEDGKPLEAEQAINVSLPQPRPPKVEKDEDDEDDGRKRSRLIKEQNEETPISITYEPNGNCTPYRVTVRGTSDGEDAEGAVITISRSGKPQVEDEDEWRRRRR